jgi:hypothetical protein
MRYHIRGAVREAEGLRISQIHLAKRAKCIPSIGRNERQGCFAWIVEGTWQPPSRHGHGALVQHDFDGCVWRPAHRVSGAGMMCALAQSRSSQHEDYVCFHSSGLGLDSVANPSRHRAKKEGVWLSGCILRGWLPALCRR